MVAPIYLNKVIDTPVALEPGDMTFHKAYGDIRLGIRPSYADYPSLGIQMDVLPTITGPITIYNNETVQYMITNYSDEVDYVIDTSTGTVSRDQYLITLQPAENYAGELMWLKINGRRIYIPTVYVTP